ncbi:MAG: arylesterase [Rhodobacteraceae bacterium]|nr:arylesterase [Paracoccaceae bacterium]
MSYWQYGGLRRLGKVAAAVLLLSGAVRAEQVDLVALGDSLTQGYGLIEQEGFVPQMRVWLKEHGAEVRLVNAGVSGDTTAGGLARVDWTLTEEIDGMIVALGGNDMLRGIDPGVSKANLAGILEAAKAKGVAVLLVGMEAPGNYGPDYKAAFDAMYGELAEDYGVLLAPSFFAGMGEASPEAIRDLMQPDGIHPNGKGVALIVEALGPEVLALVERAQ